MSVSNNRLDDLDWTTDLCSLHVLSCRHNRITRLPDHLTGLRHLAVLDVSHNRLESIPPSYLDLVSRLYRFEYFNVSLRPRYVLRDRCQLLSYLELEHLLAHGTIRPTVRHVTVAVVGESRSGKSTLVEALMSQDKTVKGKELRYMSEGTDDINSWHLNAIELSNTVMDAYSRSLNVDLYLLTIDLTTLQLHNGCQQHLFSRHLQRVQMWLQALHEVSPDTPVVLVGTHVDQVRSVSLNDIWNVLDGLLDKGRLAHLRRYSERWNHCLICSSRQLTSKRMFSRSRASAGYVDLSCPLHVELSVNGRTSSEDDQITNKFRFPHIVAYYELDAKKSKELRKSSNHGLEQLKEALGRLTRCSQSTIYRIPRQWVTFIQTLHSYRMGEKTNLQVSMSTPFVTYDNIRSIAKSCDVASTHVQQMLHYFHRRGRLVYFNGTHELLSQFVLVDTSWFIQSLRRLVDGHERSCSTAIDVLHTMSDKTLNLLLERSSDAGVTSEFKVTSSGQWLLAALQKMDICVTLVGSDDERLMLLPNLLEFGSPSHDVWPDNPEWEEKQITCDFCLRFVKPGQFTDLVLRINIEGRRYLKIVPDPVPIFLSHHIVFFSAVDQGGCDDCYNFRRRIRSKQRHDNCADLEVTDDVLHKVHIMIHSRMDAIRVQVRGVSPCCTMKAVLHFLELFLDDVPDEELDSSSDGASLSSHTTSSASPSAVSASAVYSSDGRGSLAGSISHGAVSEEEDERDLFLLCPKCVLLRHAHPGRIAYHCISPKRKAICRKWHNLGSWSRATTGDYRFSSVIEVPPAASLTMLPDYEHPRLVLILPPSPVVSNKDWYVFSRTRFLEGFEVHFLCEFTGYWHMTDDTGFRLNQSTSFTNKVGNQMQVLLNLALPLIQIIQGIPEHPPNARLVTPVITELIKMYDYLRSVDVHIHDTNTWLIKNKDRVVNMLTKVLAAAGDGMPDLYFKVNNSLNAHAIFQASSSANRYQLARFLRIDASSGRFGSLRPLYVEREIRWVCEAHYEELRSSPSL